MVINNNGFAAGIDSVSLIECDNTGGREEGVTVSPLRVSPSPPPPQSASVGGPLRGRRGIAVIGSLIDFWKQQEHRKEDSPRDYFRWEDVWNLQ